MADTIQFGNRYEMYASVTAPADPTDPTDYQLVGEMRNLRLGTTRALSQASSWESGTDRVAVAGGRTRTASGQMYFAVDGNVGQDEIEDAIDSESSEIYVLLYPKAEGYKTRYGKLVLSSHTESYPTDDYVVVDFEGQFVTFTRGTRVDV
ncbi:MAG TPA: hypothetical protein VD838_00525 [Anaeromyxobacteraceae bacterium]|nr:hypothetical protein [Anaeromyxobacteraceae bacterium]